MSDATNKQTAETEDEEEFTTPWHFKLLLLALVLYLGWRAFQGIEWLIRHFF